MKCSVCQKGTLSKSVKVQIFSYKEETISLTQPGRWCDHCEEGILSGKDVAVTEKPFEVFKSMVDHLQT